MDVSFKLNYLKESASLYLNSFQQGTQKNDGVSSLISNSQAVSIDYEKIEASLAAYASKKCEDCSKNTLKEIMKDPEALKDIEKILDEMSGNEDDPDLEKRIDELDKMLGKWSSDNSAERISSFAKGFYGYFVNKFGGGTESEDTLDSFMGLVKGAIDAGFGGAIDEMGAVSEEVGGVIKRTYDKVQAKLDSFYSESLSDIKNGGTDSENSESSVTIYSESYQKISISSSYRESQSAQEPAKSAPAAVS